MRGDFYMAQLRLRANWQNLKALGRPAYEYESPEIDAELFKNSIDAFHGSYVDTYFQKGLLGYDETMVFTPAGAAWLLNQMRTMDILDVRGTVFEETEDTELLKLIHSRNNGRVSTMITGCVGIQNSKRLLKLPLKPSGVYTHRGGSAILSSERVWNSTRMWTGLRPGQVSRQGSVSNLSLTPSTRK